MYISLFLQNRCKVKAFFSKGLFFLVKKCFNGLNTLFWIHFMWFNETNDKQMIHFCSFSLSNTTTAVVEKLMQR
jgi:hypothetical protein